MHRGADIRRWSRYRPFGDDDILGDLSCMVVMMFEELVDLTRKTGPYDIHTTLLNVDEYHNVRWVLRQ